MLERAALVITLVGGTAIGFLWPTHKAAPVAASSVLEVTLERNSDRHFYADASVNGQEIHFLVDTGASEIALTEDDAKKVGLTVEPDKYQLVGEGASGIVRGQYVQLKNVELNGIKMTDAKAVIVQGANISLLGQPFLENVDEIVIRKGEMVLRDDKNS
ncbi:TIGR02281 family clan AA aspartic protease [Sphingomonas sp. SM33]|uniref:TIGR02281 family clan AA aspartic protease n=1 Tax=Sphingomonas telluris TaxID=2907998 RepID=A0ABS9VI95_9SPHN|nr:TIGR02281 family clan AA aspartic protease [Sphingomonas telluris]MCH8614695.1 TIGR02281 family clan AA aspartic protease [Sphingomonas telluris]